MRAAEVKLNFHLNQFCPENGSSIFTRTVGVHSVSTMNAALSGTAAPRPLSVPTWLLKRRSVPLPVTLSRFLQATVLFAAPPLVLFLASHPGVLPKYLRSLRYVVCGAAPLGALDAERFLKRAPPSTEILQGNMRLFL
jgi:acyl-CoA synthetase (AMP-forming)/AMP-acid ligase II